MSDRDELTGPVGEAVDRFLADPSTGSTRTRPVLCTCPQHDVTSIDEANRGERVYLPGNPTGCPVHGKALSA